MDRNRDDRHALRRAIIARAATCRGGSTGSSRYRSRRITAGSIGDAEERAGAARIRNGDTSVNTLERAYLASRSRRRPA